MASVSGSGPFSATLFRRLGLFFRSRLPWLLRLPWIHLLDTALVISCLLLIWLPQKIFIFHIVFLLLTFGAFYWPFRSFVVRVGGAVVFITLTLGYFVAIGMIPGEELIEIPVMATILLLVFTIAHQRYQAQEALRATNRELEDRVRERTKELRTEVAERKQAEQISRENEERYRHLVDLSFEGVVIHSVGSGEILEVNPSGARLIGATDPTVLIGRSIWDFVHPDHRSIVQERLAWSRHAGQGIPLTEEEFLTVEGEPLPVEVVTLPITYRGRDAFLTVIRDLTARRQAEQARVSERLRIARDLHDSLGQNLGYLHMQLDILAGSDAAPEGSSIYDMLERLRGVANEAYMQVRSRLAALIPQYEGMELASAIRSIGRTVGRRGGFQTRVVERGEARSLHPSVRHQLICLCQEALTNAAKHAQAEHVDVELQWTDESLTITIQDDGRGFDPSDATKTSSYGLRIMEERLAQINGAFSVHSQPNQGVTLRFTVPMDPKES